MEKLGSTTLSTGVIEDTCMGTTTACNTDNLFCLSSGCTTNTRMSRFANVNDTQHNLSQWNKMQIKWDTHTSRHGKCNHWRVSSMCSNIMDSPLMTYLLKSCNLRIWNHSQEQAVFLTTRLTHHSRFAAVWQAWHTAELYLSTESTL